MNGYLIDRFGHRRVCLVSLFVMCGLFAMTIEPTGLPMLFASQILLGIPQGCLNTAARELCPRQDVRRGEYSQLSLLRCRDGSDKVSTFCYCLCQHVLGHRSYHVGDSLSPSGYELTVR